MIMITHAEFAIYNWLLRYAWVTIDTINISLLYS